MTYRASVLSNKTHGHNDMSCGHSRHFFQSVHGISDIPSHFLGVHPLERHHPRVTIGAHRGSTSQCQSPCSPGPHNKAVDNSLAFLVGIEHLPAVVHAFTNHSSHHMQPWKSRVRLSRP